jgi:hypothetical protein
MAVTELIAPIRPVFAEAIEKAAWGEDLTWDLMWAIVPTPNGPITSYVCYIHCAALHMLGAYLQRTFIVPIGTPASAIDNIVNEQIKGLMAERTRLLTQANNGGNSGAPAPGIIMP